MVLGGNLCADGMVILAVHMLGIAHAAMLLPRKSPEPAQAREQGNGRFEREGNQQRPVNADFLVHSSKYFDSHAQAEGESFKYTGTSSNSSLLLSKGREQRHKGPPGAVRHRAKSRDGKMEREF